MSRILQILQRIVFHTANFEGCVSLIPMIAGLLKKMANPFNDMLVNYHNDNMTTLFEKHPNFCTFYQMLIYKGVKVISMSILFNTMRLIIISVFFTDCERRTRGLQKWSQNMLVTPWWWVAVLVTNPPWIISGWSLAKLKTKSTQINFAQCWFLTLS